MAPALCRMMLPSPRANRPRTVRKRPPPMTARRTPGWLDDGGGGGAAQDGLADVERGEGEDLTQDEGHGAEDGHLGRQDQDPVGDGAEGGPDGAGAVLGAHHEDAEDADGELTEEKTGQAQAGGIEGQAVPGIGVGPAARLGPGGQDADGQGQNGGGDKAPDGGADAAQLGPLRAQRPGERVVARRDGRKIGHRRRGTGDGLGRHDRHGTLTSSPRPGCPPCWAGRRRRGPARRRPPRGRGTRRCPG